jgi:hypothetical protein
VIVDIARLIDHTLLRPDATADDIGRLCGETAQYRFASACVASCWVSFAREALDRTGATDIPVCSVIGFPFGSASTWAKVQETRAATGDGAGEIDAVMNVGYLRSGLKDLARLDIAVDGAGNYYISMEWNPGNVIYKVQVTDGNATGVTVANMPNPTTSIAVDSAGNLYWADGSNVYQVLASASLPATPTAVGTGLNSPSGVAFDGKREPLHHRYGQ